MNNKKKKNINLTDEEVNDALTKIQEPSEDKGPDYNIYVTMIGRKGNFKSNRFKRDIEYRTRKLMRYRRSNYSKDYSKSILPFSMRYIEADSRINVKDLPKFLITFNEKTLQVVYDTVNEFYNHIFSLEKEKENIVKRTILEEKKKESLLTAKYE